MRIPTNLFNTSFHLLALHNAHGLFVTIFIHTAVIILDKQHKVQTNKKKTDLKTPFCVCFNY